MTTGWRSSSSTGCAVHGSEAQSRNQAGGRNRCTPTPLRRRRGDSRRGWARGAGAGAGGERDGARTGRSVGRGLRRRRGRLGRYVCDGLAAYVVTICAYVQRALERLPKPVRCFRSGVGRGGAGGVVVGCRDERLSERGGRGGGRGQRALARAHATMCSPFAPIPFRSTLPIA